IVWRPTARRPDRTILAGRAARRRPQRTSSGRGPDVPAADRPPRSGPRAYKGAPKRGGLPVKVGMCGHYRPGRPTLGLARELGLDGVFFRLPFSLSESLDPAELRDGAAYAAELGLYLELGCGRINPHNWDMTPQIAAAGDGDYRRGFRRVVEACVALGHRDLHVVTGTYSDRFRADLSWPEQIAAMRAFLREVEPMLRDLGVRLNPETHEEITTVELLRLIDEFGPERLGLTFDTGNVLVQGEDPIAVARRIAPYVRQTHIKDAILFFDERGL